MTTPLLRLVSLAALLVSGPAAAQQADEPVGWPLRPKPPAHEVPKPVPMESLAPPPAEDSDAGAPGESDDRDPMTARDINAALAPIDRFTLPLQPLDLHFVDDRTALTRAEANALSRLARRLREGSERISIVASTDTTGRSAEDALRLSLTRALMVRALLVREGISIERIDLTALPHGEDGVLAGEGRVHIEKAATRSADAPQ
ncbi:MAG: OmpA family protein [Rhodothalassiaceae bacterium]